MQAIIKIELVEANDDLGRAVHLIGYHTTVKSPEKVLEFYGFKVPKMLTSTADSTYLYTAVNAPGCIIVITIL